MHAMKVTESLHSYHLPLFAGRLCPRRCNDALPRPFFQSLHNLASNVQSNATKFHILITFFGKLFDNGRVNFATIKNDLIIAQMKLRNTRSALHAHFHHGVKFDQSNHQTIKQSNDQKRISLNYITFPLIDWLIDYFDQLIHWSITSIDWLIDCLQFAGKVISQSASHKNVFFSVLLHSILPKLDQTWSNWLFCGFFCEFRDFMSVWRFSV